MAKKERIKKILVEQILDKAKIPYESIVFAGGMNRDQAELDNYGLTDHDIYKTLALIGNVTGPVIGIVPMDAHLDEKKLAAVSGNKKVNMIPTKDLQKTTGYIHGANTQLVSGKRRSSQFTLITVPRKLAQLRCQLVKWVVQSVWMPSNWLSLSTQSLRTFARLTNHELDDYLANLGIRHRHFLRVATHW